MAEWLYEAGIGENRAALIEDGAIVEAAIEHDAMGPRLGTVAAARLVDRGVGGQAMARLDDGSEVTLAQTLAGLAEGGSFTLAITREVIPEPGRRKRARGVPTNATPAPGPSLLDRLTASGEPVRVLLPHQPDALEAAGWGELLDEAMRGDIGFAGGALRLSPTPAMTLFDVDGAPPLDTLAVAAAGAVAAAIRRHAIGGSIGIDFPTLGGKAARQAVGTALDAALPPPFERTAMNGFGFVQIVRPRPRASLPELLRADAVGSAARAALRRLEREPAGAPLRADLPPAVRARIEARADWMAELMRRTGRAPIWG